MATEPKAVKSGAFKRLGASAPVAVVLSFWPPLGGFVLLAGLTRLGPWLRHHDGVGMLIYFLLAGALLGISFLPTYSCAILAGWAFGFWAGWPLAMVTITAGGLLAYAIGRWVAKDRVLEVIGEIPRWSAIYHSLLGGSPVRTTTVVGLLRVPPASPFALANFVLAAARVPLGQYTLGTVLGIAPRTAMATFAAAGLEQLQFKNVTQTWVTLAGIAATVVVCVTIGVLANRALRRMS